LRRFVEGAYADGVIASLPTVTYPNHTTLITGVWPSVHGILNNQLFDPEHKLAGALYWYAESIKVASTVAAILGVNLPSAKQPKLPIAP
jgi:predicted AlkP superfamily pyrophosphatase or phosphodiesterase